MYGGVWGGMIGTKCNEWIKAALCLQATFTSIICATLFLRTHISPDGIDNAHLYASFLFFATLQMFFNGIAEMTLTVSNAFLV